MRIRLLMFFFRRLSSVYILREARDASFVLSLSLLIDLSHRSINNARTSRVRSPCPNVRSPSSSHLDGAKRPTLARRDTRTGPGPDLIDISVRVQPRSPVVDPRQSNESESGRPAKVVCRASPVATRWMRLRMPSIVIIASKNERHLENCRRRKYDINKIHISFSPSILFNPLRSTTFSLGRN